MMTFLTIVLAIIVAQVLMSAVLIALICNERVMMAYMNWVMKMTEKVTAKMFEKDGEL